MRLRWVRLKHGLMWVSGTLEAIIIWYYLSIAVTGTCVQYVMHVKISTSGLMHTCYFFIQYHVILLSSLVGEGYHSNTHPLTNCGGSYYIIHVTKWALQCHIIMW